jgi:hypothetical protein
MSQGHEPSPQQIIMQMTMGMWVSQMVGTLARLGIPDHIAAGRDDSDAIADATGCSRDAIYRLMRAMATVGVLAKTGPRKFALTPVGEALRDKPGSLRDFAISETDESHWLPWGKLADAIKTGKPTTHATLGGDVWGWYAKHPAEAESFSRSMSGLSAMAGKAVMDKFDVAPFSTIVDVGGAFGEFLAQALAKNPSARGIVFDLPHVIAQAKPSLEKRGLHARVEAVGGSFFESVPSGGDLYLLKHILHDWSDDECRTILTRVREAMGKSATLLIGEFIIPEDGTPSPAPLIDINMMVMLTGRERTVAEYEALLSSAGLKLAHVIKTDAPVAGLVAVVA